MLEGQLGQVHRPGGTLIQTVKQPCGLCCLTEHVFARVQCEQQKDDFKALPAQTFV